LGATRELDACRWLVHNEKVYPIHTSSSSIQYGALVGHDFSKVCKMSKAAVQGNLMGFGPKPKPIFPLMGPSDKEYSVLIFLTPIHFMASLGHSGLGSSSWVSWGWEEMASRYQGIGGVGCGNLPLAIINFHNTMPSWMTNICRLVVYYASIHPFIHSFHLD